MSLKRGVLPTNRRDNEVLVCCEHCRRALCRELDLSGERLIKKQKLLSEKSTPDVEQRHLIRDLCCPCEVNIISYLYCQRWNNGQRPSQDKDPVLALKHLAETREFPPFDQVKAREHDRDDTVQCQRCFTTHYRAHDLLYVSCSICNPIIMKRREKKKLNVDWICVGPTKPWEAGRCCTACLSQDYAVSPRWYCTESCEDEAIHIPLSVEFGKLSTLLWAHRAFDDSGILSVLPKEIFCEIFKKYFECVGYVVWEYYLDYVKETPRHQWDLLCTAEPS